MLSPYIYLPATCIAIYTFIIIMQNSPPNAQSIPADVETTDMNAGLIKTTAIVSAAQILLSLFDASSLATLQFPYNATDQPTPVYFPHPKLPNFRFVGEQFGASTWSNFPVSDVPRPGIRLGGMNTAQHSAVMHLLRTALSEKGFRKVQEIMGSDQILADSGVPYAAGRAAYTAGIFGEPGMEKVWMIQFGGHHLALNIAVCGGNAVLTPLLTGALPASYTGEDGEKRVLADENDKAFALMRSFSESQRKQAVFTHPVSDMVQGPGDFDKTLPDVGIQGSHLDSSQKEMLLDLISEWVGILNDVHSASRIAEVQNGLDNTCFAWSGPLEHELGRNGASYFRIQGPNLFIEFSPQFPGGDLTMHVHTIYRDPSRAYGRTLPKDLFERGDYKELL